MKIKYSLSLLLSFCLLQSCTTGTNVKTEWCTYMALGMFEGKTDDGTMAYVEFTQLNENPYYINSEGFFISYEFPNGQTMVLEGGTKIEDFFELSDDSKDIKLNKVIKLKPHGISLGDEYLSNSDFEIGEVSLTYISSDKIKIEFYKVYEVLKEFSSSNNGSGLNSMVLSKTCGIQDCIDFDPDLSYNLFTQEEQQFIYHDLQNWEVAGKELMLDYMLRKPEIESKMWGGWNKSLVGVGTVFKLDLNGDNEQDLCGYFTHEFEKEKTLVFKIFMYNGFTYDEVYSEDISDYYGGDGIFFPCDKIICISYLDKAGGALYYNKLTNEFQKHWHD